MCLFFFTGRNVGVQFDLAAGRTECRLYLFLVTALFDRDHVKEQIVFDLDLVIHDHFSMTNGTVRKTPTSRHFDTPSLAYKTNAVYWRNENGYHEKNNKGRS